MKHPYWLQFIEDIGDYVGGFCLGVGYNSGNVPIAITGGVLIVTFIIIKYGINYLR